MWQLCPKCQGQRLVVRPPWVAGDVTEWTSNLAGPFKCGMCDGKGRIKS